MPQVIESFDEFRQRQGCEHINLGSEVSRTGETVNRFVFANGAYSDSSGHYDPPDDTKVRLVVQRDFLKTKLSREERAFHAFKQDVVNQGALHARYSNLPAVTPEAVDQLRRGQERILRLRELLAKVEAQLVDPEAARKQQAKANLEGELRKRHLELLRQIQSIEV
jgi:hypothetical protein